jgi:hypothetical protein
MYPKAAWHVTHVVLEDENYDTEYIESAIAELTNPSGEFERFGDTSEWVLQALAYLRFLLTIPEDERLAPNDEAD